MRNFLLLILALLPGIVLAQETPKPADIKRFQIEKPQTPERMEYFIEHPPTSEEYEALEQQKYDMEKIACYTAEHHPDKIDDAFSAVNFRFIPRCEQWSLAKKVPELQPLMDRYWKLSGISYMCGTIRIDIGAGMASTLIKMGANPNYIKSTGGDISTSKLNDDMLLWASKGVWEKEQYEALQKEKASILPAVTNYYSNQFHLSKQQASEGAQAVLTALDRNFLSRYNPCEYKTLVHPDGVTAFLAHPSYEALDAQLKDCRTIFSHNEWLASMLQTSIVQHRDIADIQKLISLLEKPIDPETLMNPIHQAAPYYPEALKLLLKVSPQSVNVQNAFGKTALMYAVQYKNSESVKVLLSHKADINLPTHPTANETAEYGCESQVHLEASKRTTLMYAAWYATPEVVSTLLEAGADKKMIDTQGTTACGYLHRNFGLSNIGSDDMRKLLCY